MQLGAAELEDTEGAYHKFVKLRDPWGKKEPWEGSNSSGVKSLWNKLVSSQQKK